MASFKLTIEDSSPLVTYSPATSWSDSENPEYSGGSLHTTSAQGASATFKFSGTGISLFGGVRPEYGTYSVTLDGQTLLADSSSSRPAAAVKQLLASAKNLDHKQHTLVITNTGSSPIDIDSAEIDCEIGNPGSLMQETRYDDNDPRITYLPSPSDWRLNRGEDFMDNTLHFSDSPNAAASLTFAGDAVAVYGTVAPDHANIKVTIDGRETTLAGGAGGAATALHPKTLLWYGDNLGQEQHTLQVSSVLGEGTGPFLDIDQISVFAASGGNPGPGTLSLVGATQSVTPTGATSFGESPPTSSPVAATSTKGKLALPIASIILIAVGAFLAIITILGCLFFVRRRRRLQRTQPDVEKRDAQPSSPSLPFQQSPVVTRPTYDDSRYTSPVNPPPMASRASASSLIIPFYVEARGNTGTSDLGHSRDGSVAGSISSTSKLIPSAVPILGVPRPPRSAVISRAPTMYQIPARPSQRPPPLDVE